MQGSGVSAWLSPGAQGKADGLADVRWSEQLWQCRGSSPLLQGWLITWSPREGTCSPFCASQFHKQ